MEDIEVKALKLSLLTRDLKIVFSRAMTAGHLQNLLRNTMEFRLGKTHLRSYPRNLNIEITNVCNLRCVACPTHVTTSARSKKFMSLADYKRIVDQVGRKTYLIDLGGNGEPTLVPHIGEMIRYAGSYRMFTRLSSNFNTSQEVMEELFKSGLMEINASIDGFSQGTYEKARTGGNFDLAISNLRYLASLRGNALYPVIQWQFIPNRYNEHEIGAAKACAEEMGVDFTLGQPFVPGGDAYFFQDEEGVREFDEFTPTNEELRIKDRQALLGCYQPFTELNVLVNGDVDPCCRLREQNVIIGNILRDSFEDIWNSDGFVYFRSQLVKQGSCKSCVACRRNWSKFNHNPSK